jgi:hypothetical protein
VRTGLSGQESPGEGVCIVVRIRRATGPCCGPVATAAAFLAEPIAQRRRLAVRSPAFRRNGIDARLKPERRPSLPRVGIDTPPTVL